MARSIQCLKNPNLALNRMLSLSKRCVVTLPNLGYWKCRLNIMNGRMPVTPELPSSWYETENIHLCTIKDFEKLCADEKINIIDKVFLNRKGNRGKFTSLIPNLLAVEGVYLLEK
jgi:methionine biosynthesis protein MetW